MTIIAWTIEYVKTEEGRTFLYCERDTYECKSGLGELEEQLRNMAFVRISKNTIVNIRKLKCVLSIGMSRMEVLLNDNEKHHLTRNQRQHTVLFFH